MNARRRRLILALVALVLCGLAAVWFTSGDGVPDVRLVFLGYTNRPPHQVPAAEFPSRARFLITNAGSCAVKISDRIVYIHSSEEQRYMSDRLAGFPIKLAPGRSLSIETPDHNHPPVWKAEVTYTARPTLEPLAAKVWSSTNGFARNVGRRLLREPRYQNARSDWITNPPGAIYGIDTPSRGLRIRP